MSKEKNSADTEPDAWKPGVFGMLNSKGLRESHEVRWAGEAKAQNKARNIGQKLTMRGRASAESVMRAEADKNNAAYDADSRGVPSFLYKQKLSKAILEEAGIEQPHFPTPEALEQALHNSPALQGIGSYHGVTGRAYEKVTGNSLPSSQTQPIGTEVRK